MSKVIMIGGLPGSGKSYLANALSKKMNAVHLSSDLVRKELDKHGKYERTDKEFIYTEMKKLLRHYLDKGNNVIVDATFYKSKLRREIIEIAKNKNVKPFFILATANEATIKKRVSVKRPDSEANYEVYRKIKEQFEPVNINYLELDTSLGDLERMIKKVSDYCEL